MFRAAILLAVVAAAFAVSVQGPRAHHLRRQIKINDDLADIKALLDEMTLGGDDDFLEPTRKRLCEDKDIKTLVDYAKTDDFQTKLQALLNVPELQDLISIVLSSGADIEKFTNFIQSLLNCDATPSKKFSTNADKLYALIEKHTLEEIVPIYHERIQKEADLVKLLNCFNQGQGLDDLHKIIASAEWKAILDAVTAKGANADRDIKLVKELVGINDITKAFMKIVRKLNEPIDDIKALLDKMTLDDILVPARKRVCEDGDIQKLIAYAKTDQFQTRIQALLNLAEVQDLISLVLSSGVDIEKFTNFIQSFLNCDSAKFLIRLRDDKDDLYKLLEQVTLDVCAPAFHDRFMKEPDLKTLDDLFTTGPGKDDLDKASKSQEVADIRADIKATGANETRCLQLLCDLTGVCIQ